MLKGTLVVTVEPASISFCPENCKAVHRSYCTEEDIRQLLVDLHAITLHDIWPQRDFQLHMPGMYSRQLLSKYSVLPAKGVA